MPSNTNAYFWHPIFIKQISQKMQRSEYYLPVFCKTGFLTLYHSMILLQFLKGVATYD